MCPKGSYTPVKRQFFLDNLRSLMVVLVLVFHSGASYTSMVAFWPYHDANPSNFIEILTILLDTFMMTILFFIAGYFALPSLQKKGSTGFLKDKFKRLGIPWLIVMISVLPALDYFHYFTQSVDSGTQPHGYGMHWLLSMRKFAEFYVGRMPMSEYLNMTEHTYQRYMWFLSLLLLFFVVFWLLTQTNQKWGRPMEQGEGEEPPSKKTVNIAWTGVGLGSILIFVGVKIFFSSPANPIDLVWFSLGNIFQFQLAKLAFYIPAFGLGVYAFSKRWFVHGQGFGRPGVWSWTVFILMVVNMLVARTMTRLINPPIALQAAFLVLYPLWTLSLLGFFVSLASRRWNTSSTLNRSMAANSYNMYLVHYIFVMTLPLVLSGWTGVPVLLKFGLVAVSTCTLSYLVSRYVLHRYPRLVVLALLGLNLFLVILT